jgi:hypothetical protein
MIESEEMRQVIEKDIERWCNLVKATPLLRAGDISSLADTILQEFFHIRLCCGQWFFLQRVCQRIYLRWIRKRG